MLSACSSISVDEYADKKPVLNLEEFFNGPLTAKGVLKNRSGKVTRSFIAQLNGTWENGTGTLKEVFVFDDGEIQHRTWTLTPIKGDKKTYLARAGDVKGTTQIHISGNAMNFIYTLEITYKNKPLALQVDDWMWLVDDKTVINESILRKWGFKVGSIQSTIQKVGQSE